MAQTVVCSESVEIVLEAKYRENPQVRADGYRSVALLCPIKRYTRNICPFTHQGNRYPPP